MLSRVLRTSLPRHAAAAALSVRPPLRRMSTAKKEESIVDIVKEYGAMTFVGLGSAILVSKELFMVNEEVLVLGVFSGVIFYGYVTLYDDVTNTLQEYKDTIRSEQIAIRDRMIASLSEAAEEHKKYTGLSTEIKKAFDHVGKTSADFCGAVNLTIEQDKINSIEAELQDLADANAFIESHQKNYIMKTAAVNLNTYLQEKLPQKDKDNFFKWAVDMLEGKSSDSNGDFVTAQFKKELEAVLKEVNNKDPKAASAKVDKLIEEGFIDDGSVLKNARKLANM